MIVAGLVQILHGHVGMSRGPAVPLPLTLMYTGMSLLAMFQYWRRGGYFRFAARQGGWRLGAAILGSLGAASFAVFMSLGQTTLGVAGWLVCGLSNIPW